MNNFQDSPLNKEEEPEESSWTFYFEELLWQNDQEMIMSTYNEKLNSFVSDAASSVIVKKSACIEDDQAEKLRFKKRKIKEVMLDDSLEDTASSPLSSPNVTYFDRVTFKNTKTLHVSEEKVDTCDEINNIKANANVELKKRGLCLVPLSSLVNYLS
uniref:Lysine-specific demethylase n=1 Tax=Tanacetum cinerariifolium TaxID=118510 RepID=A0A6L2NRB8_TANCI|nr:lysine-specific demethylase [Tanacetum cinerariifolium]